MVREVQRSAFDFDRSLSLLYPALFSCTKAPAFLPPSLLTGSQELRWPSPGGLAAFWLRSGGPRVSASGDTTSY